MTNAALETDQHLLRDVIGFVGVPGKPLGPAKNARVNARHKAAKRRRSTRPNVVDQLRQIVVRRPGDHRWVREHTPETPRIARAFTETAPVVDGFSLRCSAPSLEIQTSGSSLSALVKRHTAPLVADPRRDRAKAEHRDRGERHGAARN